MGMKPPRLQGLSYPMEASASKASKSNGTSQRKDSWGNLHRDGFGFFLHHIGPGKHLSIPKKAQRNFPSIFGLQKEPGSKLASHMQLFDM